jgi:hypothetical protein
VREITHVCAAVVFLDRYPQEPEVAHLLPQVGGKLIAAVDLRGARRDLFGGELPHAFAQHIDRFAEMKIQSGEVQHCHHSSDDSIRRRPFPTARSGFAA